MDKPENFPAMRFLTDFDRQFVVDAVMDAVKVKKCPPVASLNAELLQLESTVTHLIRAHRNALISGEPADSDYIIELEKKLTEKAARRDEIEARLAERRDAA